MTSIHLTPAERQVLFDRYRRAANPDVRLRAHILLLLAHGYEGVQRQPAVAAELGPQYLAWAERWSRSQRDLSAEPLEEPGAFGPDRADRARQSE